MNKVFSVITRIVAILLVIVIALIVRIRAVEMLPVDYDEDDYLRAGQLYTNGLRQGDWSVFTRENYRTEHPPLSKIVYGFALLTVPPFEEIPDLPVTAGPNQNLPPGPLNAARSISALFNLISVAILALINPLAGLFLGVHTFTIKYTAQVMLEGVPSLTSLLVVVFYNQYLRSGNRTNFWLILSAVLLGLTAAAKYYYALPGIAVLIHWLWSRRRTDPAGLTATMRWLAPVLAWSGLALLVFFLANPYLWPDPIGRLSQSVLYHGGYAQSQQVRSAGAPWWQPLNWLSISVPWHPDVFIIGIDLIISLLALLGLSRFRQRHPVFALWLGLGLAFLLIWPTKWAQYVLLITPPLALAAADGFSQQIAEPLLRLVRRLTSSDRALSKREKTRYAKPGQYLPWLLPGLIALAVITLFPLVFQFAISMTDFENTAIKDGIQGGVWREVWRGITGQVEPVSVAIFDRGGSSNKVHYAGLMVLLQILFGAGEFYVFELIWTLLAVLTQTALGVAIALLLHREGVRFRGFWQALFILPWAVPEFVAALSWSQVFDARFGYLTLAAKPWSQQTPGVAAFTSSWQENPNFALVVLLIAALWYGFPIMLLSARAGLKLIPIEVFDAAALDGATRWALFQHITWPLIFPLLVPAIIIRAIFAFNQFYLFTVLQTPMITFSAISYFFFNDGRYAVSAAINVVVVIILIGLVAWFNRLSRATEGISYA